jgi:Flp pilus assembly protein TadG
MTARHPLLARITRDRTGTTAVEFALVGPAVIGLMLGVFQVGMAMQSHNAIRSVTAEAARYATVEFQKGATPADLTNDEIEEEALDIADEVPYVLVRSRVTVNVVDAPTQRVNGAREMTITVSYTPPPVLPLFDWASPTVTHTRPIFVIKSS